MTAEPMNDLTQRTDEELAALFDKGGNRLLFTTGRTDVLGAAGTTRGDIEEGYFDDELDSNLELAAFQARRQHYNQHRAVYEEGTEYAEYELTGPSPDEDAVAVATVPARTIEELIEQARLYVPQVDAAREAHAAIIRSELHLDIAKTILSDMAFPDDRGLREANIDALIRRGQCEAWARAVTEQVPSPTPYLLTQNPYLPATAEGKEPAQVYLNQDGTAITVEPHPNLIEIRLWGDGSETLTVEVNEAFKLSDAIRDAAVHAIKKGLK